MNNCFEKYNISLSEQKKEKFSLFYGILKIFNDKFNLTAITEENEVYIKHFIDSILGEKFVVGKKMIDIGSGGGFPAIPIKIMKDDLSVTLVEATGKKCEYLKILSEKLDLKDVKVIFGRAEELAADDCYREKFDTCTARAVAKLNVLCEYCLPFVKKGGVFIAFKGDAEQELKEAENAVKTLGGVIKTVERFDLEGAKRDIVVIEKIAPTDRKYPRTNGKIRKYPL